MNEAIFVPALIMYREGLEAFLLTSFLLKISENHKLQHRYTAFGILGGVVVSILIALSLHVLTVDYEKITGIMTFMTGLVMLYVAFYNAKVSKHINEHIGEIEKFTPLAMFLAVVGIFSREGAEVVLMLYSLWMNDPHTTFYGSIVGLVLLLVSYRLVKFGLDKIGTGLLFKYSSWIFALLGFYYIYDALEIYRIIN